MANKFINSQYYQDIANAIRSINGLSRTYTPPEMAQAILDLDISTDEVPELIGLEIVTLPNRIKYGVNNAFNPTGIVVKALYAGGYYKFVSDDVIYNLVEGYVFEHSDRGIVEIIVTYVDEWNNIASDSFNVTIYPTFAESTDAEIVNTLSQYYNNYVTWDELGWKVGDTRKIHLDSYASPSPNSSTTTPAQDITVIIIDHDHTPLATPINGHNNACITVQFRETVNSIYVDGGSGIDRTFTQWGKIYMRSYINNTLLNAFDDSFKSIIKPSTHYRRISHSGTSSSPVTDTLFLPSYPEIFGTESFNYYVATNPDEGTQFEYYKTIDNRLKYSNNNGESSGATSGWWTGSACSNYVTDNSYMWCGVNLIGTVSNYIGYYSLGLAPAFAM